MPKINDKTFENKAATPPTTPPPPPADDATPTTAQPVPKPKAKAASKAKAAPQKEKAAKPSPKKEEKAAPEKKDPRGGTQSPPTRTHPRTGKIMTAEDKAKEKAKADKDAEKKRKIEEREQKAAEKKAEREAKEKERAEKKAKKQEEEKSKSENKDAEVARRNAIADALLKDCQELGVKSPSLRKLVKEQGESLDVDSEGKAVVLDARGENPLRIGPYLESLGEEVTSELRKSQKKRKTGWPKREPSNRVRPEDHGVVKLDARPPALKIDKNKPWSKFAPPQGVLMNVQDATVVPNMATVQKDGKDEEVMAGLRLTAKGEDLGVFDREAVRELGRMIGFKVDFVDKLSSDPALACQVVNHMIGEYRPQLMLFAGDGERVRDVCPGWRETASHAEVCQKAWDVLNERFKDVEVKTCDVDKSGHLEFVLTVDAGSGQVTKKAGDYLKGGVRVTHRYGTEVKVGLFVERLVCENGMTSSSTTYSWTSRGAGSVSAQLDYLAVQAIDSMAKFEALVKNAKKMAATKVTGDPEQAIKERMRQMGVPARHLDGILEAFRLEPGDSEWHMLNAITRFATHTLGIGRSLREALMEGSGDWVRQFDVVKARIPRSIATRVGAEIISED